MIHFLDLPPMPIAGDTVTIRVAGPNGTACAARPHDDGDSQPVDLKVRGKNVVEGEFTPDRPGRWWVTARYQGSTAEACFWVKPRQVKV